MAHLVDNDARQVAEQGVGLQLAQQHPSRAIQQPGGAARARLQPDLIAAQRAGPTRPARFPQLGADARGQGERGNASGLGANYAQRGGACGS